MKRFKQALVIIIGLLILAAGNQLACSKKGGKLAQMVSKDAQLVVLIPNIGRAAANLGSFLDYLASKSPFLASMKQQMNVKAGFDITKAEELAKKGFDPNGGFAFAMMNMKTSDGYGVLSVKDEKVFVAFLNEMYQKEGKPELKKEGEFYSIPDGGFLTFKKGFAVFGEKQDSIAKAGTGDSIDGSDAFKTAMKNIGEGGDITVYFSPEFIKTTAKQGMGDGQEAKAIDNLSKIYGAMITSLSFAKSDIEAKSYVQILDITKVKKIMSTASASEMMAKVPDGAPVLARYHLNLPEFWAFMKEMMASSDPKTKQGMETGIAQAGQALGMDIEKDIIANLDGNPVFAFYGMTGKRNSTPDLLLTITLKDEAKVKNAIQKISAMMNMGRKPGASALAALGVIEIASPGGAIYLAVIQKNLVLSTTPERMQAIMALLAGSGGGRNALASVSHADAKKALDDKNVDVLYIDISMLLGNMKKGLSRQEAQKIDMYLAQAGGVQDAYLLVNSSITDQGIVGGIKIHLGQ